MPEPVQSVRLFMTNVANSQTFFARFGFATVGTIHSGRPNIKLECSSALLDSTAWRLCRDRIDSLGLVLPKAEVPRIDPLRPPPGQENQTGIMVVQDWKLRSKLNQAVSIQLAGLIGLFVVPRPYNWLGWLLIILGGVLYRLELKRRKG